MASPSASEDPDSKNSTVGIKRGYEKIVMFEDRPYGANNVSAENHDTHLEKRRRYDSSQGDLLRVPSAEQFKIPAKLINNSTGVAENDDVSRHSQNQVHTAMSPAITWNQGIPVPIRTSFGASASRKQPESYQLPISQRQSAIQDSPAVNHTSVQSTETVNANALLNPPISSTQNPITGAMPRSMPGTTRIRNDNWRWIFTEKDKSIAEIIVTSLPEDQRDLMPSYISDDLLSFTANGCRFILDRIDVSLREICFVQNQKESFVIHFLRRNLAVLEKIDYSVLTSAFSKYMELFYGQFPKILVSLVSRNKRIKSKGTKAQCNKALSDAKDLSRTAGAGKAKAEIDPDGCELKLLSNHETRPNTRSNGQADEIQKPKSSDNSRDDSDVQPQAVSTDELVAGVAALDIPSHSDPVTGSVIYGSGVRPSSRAPINDSINKDAGAMIYAIREMEVGPTMDLPRNNILPRSETGVGATELELLHRYYPADDKDSFVPRCLTCSDLNHRTSDCPLLTCATCGLRGVHFTDACPQSQRCARCRTQGHDKSKCQEKLAATSGEKNCDTCGSKNHLEDKCHFLWRSFRPDSLKQKRLLEDIPVYCYCCGTNSHFGSQCGIRSTPFCSEGWTWSRTNWERYVDVKNSKRVFDSGKGKSLKSVHFNRGEETHELIRLDVDDDDDDVEFISRRVLIPPSPVKKGKQKIKFVSKKNDEQSFMPRPDPHPTRLGLRQEPQRASKEQRYPNDRDVDYFNSYRPPNSGSNRGRRMRSFSPPSHVNVRDQYGDISYRPDYSRDVPHFRGYSDGRKGSGGDVLRGRESRGGIAKSFVGRGSGKRGGGSTRAERRKKREARLNQVTS